MQGGAEARWGEETTDESEGEVAHYNGRRREITDSAATVFADAAEEFASLPALKARLEAWKASHSSEYSTSVCPFMLNILDLISPTLQQHCFSAAAPAFPCFVVLLAGPLSTCDRTLNLSGRCCDNDISL